MCIIDRPCTQDTTNPAYKAKMDKIAEGFRAEGYRVLFNVKGHFDHMHVEISKAAEAAMKKTSQQVTSVAAVATKKIEDAPSVAANDNEDIPVTAKRKDPITVPLEPAFDFTKMASGLPQLTQKVVEPYQNEFMDKLQIITQNGEDSMSAVFGKMADQLGPQGTIIPTIMSGLDSIGQAYANIKDVFAADSSPAEKFSAIAAAAQTALSTIQSALSASAQAKEESIQREIDAETKRDGKSAESVAKIASLEKKKDEVARKQFNTNKKLMMAQAVIATASGVAQALGSLPFPANIALAGVIGAMGAAQLAIISGTQYQSTAATAAAETTVPSLSIGKRGDTVDLAKQNNNVGGELGYLHGAQGTGTNASNYNVVGSAYGGDLPRGYGNTAYVVGEKGPETIVPQVPVSVRPANDNNNAQPIHAEFHISAIDASGVEEVLRNQQGNLISMFREAANANGQRFLEDVNTNVYSRPNKTAGSRL